MDCHDPDNTHFELIGVFKETHGLEQWAEQLFKHEGFCLWNGDKDYSYGYGYSGDYDFMQSSYDEWMSYMGCSAVSGFTDDNGNTLYSDAKPASGAKFEYGLYTDSKCTKLSDKTWRQYLVNAKPSYSSYFSYYSGGYNQYQQAQNYVDDVKRWNYLMNDYKVCQPCRAYRKDYNGYGNNGAGQNENNGNDGQGSVEQWGYNCNDYAGYQNVNQCYKFMTHTDLEEASANDLQRASSQGTILPVTVRGVAYGKGSVQNLDSSTHDQPTQKVQTTIIPIHHALYNEQRDLLGYLLVAVIAINIMICVFWKWIKHLRRWSQKRQFKKDVRDHLISDDDSNVETSSSDEEEYDDDDDEESTKNQNKAKIMDYYGGYRSRGRDIEKPPNMPMHSYSQDQDNSIVTCTSKKTAISAASLKSAGNPPSKVSDDVPPNAVVDTSSPQLEDRLKQLEDRLNTIIEEKGAELPPPPMTSDTKQEEFIVVTNTESSIHPTSTTSDDRPRGASKSSVQSTSSSWPKFVGGARRMMKKMNLSTSKK